MPARSASAACADPQQGRVELATLFVEPARLDDLSPHEIPALLVQVASLQSALAARLAAASPANSKAEPDHLLTVDEAAGRLAVTKDWLRRRPHLPFVVKLSDGVVRYSATGISRFIAQQQQR